MPVGGVTSDLSPANVEFPLGAGMGNSLGVQVAAGQAGGKRRGRRSRRARSSRRGGARRRSRKSRKSRKSRR